jgi:glycosyltransferase involved in cell wall biosynthesis
MPHDYDATILFTTKNRRDELRKALASALTQTGARCEVLVIDDGSTDATAQMCAQEFPSVRVIRHEQSAGYIVRRNEGAREARSPVVFSVDDDATFSDPSTVAHTLRELAHPRVGAVAIPYIDVLKTPDVHQRAPDEQGVWIASEYRGTAHALRRDLFLALGGYRENLIHQCEEGDYCYRLLDAGYVTRRGTAAPIHHFESPKRDLTRQMTFSTRNNLLLAWHNVPMPRFLIHAPGTIFNTLRAAARAGYFRTALRGTLWGLKDCATGAAPRQPVSPAAYRLYRRLRVAGATRFEEIEAALNPPRQPANAAARQTVPA